MKWGLLFLYKFLVVHGDSGCSDNPLYRRRFFREGTFVQILSLKMIFFCKNSSFFKTNLRPRRPRNSKRTVKPNF